MHISRCSALLALLLNTVEALAAVDNHGGKGGEKKQWTGIWATMPQLTEPANLPPAPYVSSNIFQMNRTRIKRRNECSR